jgi:GT2 family glycosyltransferase
MDQPVDVLVIIVNYRSAALTVRGVESLAAERALHPELNLHAVVVENASGDEQALREGLGNRFDDWMKLVISPRNGGFGYGNNLGMKLGMEMKPLPRYFHFLNPDALVRPGGVSELVKFLDAHPQAGMAGGRFENEDGSDWAAAFRFPTVWSELEEGFTLGPISKVLSRHIVRRVMDDQPAQADWLSGASVMVRREMIDQIGGFDEEYFLYFEETDLALRAQRAGWQTWYVPASRVMHIAGASTGVTSRDGAPKPLPRYWFESRRRFFSKNHGVPYATLADLAFVAAHAVGTVKRTLRGQSFRPRLLRDFLSQAASFHLGGRVVAPVRDPLRGAATATATTDRTP